MKRYDNINFYFNTAPRTLALVVAIWYGLCTAGSLLLGIAGMDTFGIGMVLASVLCSGIICVLFVRIYTSQFTLVNARVGKNLKKLYGMSNDELEAAFTQINQEMSYPRYASVNPKKKTGSFFITNNWIIGTDGVMMFRANAVKLCNITSINKNYLVRSNRGGSYYYFVVEITDIKNHVYRFYLNSEEERDKAFNFLMNLFNQGQSVYNQ